MYQFFDFNNKGWCIDRKLYYGFLAIARFSGFRSVSIVWFMVYSSDPMAEPKSLPLLVQTLPSHKPLSYCLILRGLTDLVMEVS